MLESRNPPKRFHPPHHKNWTRIIRYAPSFAALQTLPRMPTTVIYRAMQTQDSKEMVKIRVLSITSSNLIHHKHLGSEYNRSIQGFRNNHLHKIIPQILGTRPTNHFNSNTSVSQNIIQVIETQLPPQLSFPSIKCIMFSVRAQHG